MLMTRMNHPTMIDFTPHIKDQQNASDVGRAVSIAIVLACKLNEKEADFKNIKLSGDSIHAVLDQALQGKIIARIVAVPQTMRELTPALAHGMPVLFQARMNERQEQDAKLTPHHRMDITEPEPKPVTQELPPPAQPSPQGLFQKMMSFIGGGKSEPAAEAAKPAEPAKGQKTTMIAAGYVLHRGVALCWTPAGMAEVPMEQILNPALVDELWTLVV